MLKTSVGWTDHLHFDYWTTARQGLGQWESNVEMEKKNQGRIELEPLALPTPKMVAKQLRSRFVFKLNLSSSS